MQKNNIDTIINDIKRSPLFYLFSSSKELFHSNFWFWLSTLNKIETLKLFVQELDIEISTITFQRERQFKNKESKINANIDLVINVNEGLTVIIENKIKDYPQLNQLARIIDASIDNKNQFKYVLVSLFATNKFQSWDNVTYKDISNNIKAENFTDNLYYQSLITDYKELCLNLHNFTRDKTCSTINIYNFDNSFNPSLFKYLDALKLRESYLKYRLSHLKQYIESSPIWISYNKQNIVIDTSINNKKSTISFKLAIDDSHLIGIQIEGNQFRTFVETPQAEIFANYLLNENIFFDCEYKSPTDKSFLKYSNNFRYQYEQFNENLMTFDALIKKIIYRFKNFDLKKIKKIANY